MRWIVLVALPLALAACNANYTWYGIPKDTLPSDAQVNARSHALAGQPVDVVVSGLGAPSADQVVAGRHLMTWSNNWSDVGVGCKLTVAEGADNRVERAWFVGARGPCAGLAGSLPNVAR